MRRFCWNLHDRDDEGYLYVNKTKICKYKTKDNTIWYSYCLGSASRFYKTWKKISEISSDCTIYDCFSFDYSSIKTEDFLNIHQYFVVQNIIE